MAADIAALVADKAFGALKAPIRRVTAPHTPVPFAPSLEKLYIPSPEQIAAAIREVHGYAVKLVTAVAKARGPWSQPLEARISEIASPALGMTRWELQMQHDRQSPRSRCRNGA